MSTAAVIAPKGQSVPLCSNGLTLTKKLSKDSIHVNKGTAEQTSADKLADAKDEDKRTLETAIQKLLKKENEKKKLSADFTYYELQMIWEAPVEKLKTLLTLSSTEDVEFLQSLCCDLFLCYDNYRGASTMDELLKREKDWEQKLDVVRNQGK